MTDETTVDKRAISKSTLAKKIRDSIRDRVVRQDEFYDHLNKTVFVPVLGAELSRQAVKDIVFGIADQISYIVLAGGRVRMGKIGTFKPHVTPSGQRWNPQTQTNYEAPEKVKLAFRASDSSRRVFSQTGTLDVNSDVDV